MEEKKFNFLFVKKKNIQKKNTEFCVPKFQFNFNIKFAPYDEYMKSVKLS